MGCSFSRLEVNRATLAARLRPLFLHRVEAMKARRLARRPRKDDSTPSKKELLSREEENPSISSNNPSNRNSNVAYSLEDIIKRPELPNGIKPVELKIETPKKNVAFASTVGNNYGMKVVREDMLSVKGENNTKESPITDAKARKGDAFGDIEEEEDDDDDDDDDNERMIGHGDGEAFQASPSFRIYFKENLEDSNKDIGKTDAFEETVSTGDHIVPSKESSSEEKKGRKKRFRKVLTKFRTSHRRESTKREKMQ